MISDAQNQCLVRILDREEGFHGFGFVVPAHKSDCICIATCVHVVAEALWFDNAEQLEKCEKNPTPPKAPVSVLFDKRVEDGEPLSAFVLPEADWEEHAIKGWAIEDDVAILTVTGVTMDDVGAIIPDYNFATLTDPVYVYGIVPVLGEEDDKKPGARDMGKWKPCNLELPAGDMLQLDPDISGRLQKDSELRRIMKGDSGGPVWSNSDQAVVGMVTQRHKETGATGLALNIHTIANVWRPLRAMLDGERQEGIDYFLFFDREDQLKKLNGIVNALYGPTPGPPGRPVVVALDGPWNAGHVEFVNRLSKFVLPERFGLKDPVATLELLWPPPPKTIQRRWWPFGKSEADTEEKHVAGAWHDVCDKLNMPRTTDLSTIAGKVDEAASKTAIVFDVTFRQLEFSDSCGGAVLAWLAAFERMADQCALATEVYICLRLETNADIKPIKTFSTRLPDHFAPMPDAIPNRFVTQLKEVEYAHFGPWLTELKRRNLMPGIEESVLDHVIRGVFQGNPLHFHTFKEGAELQFRKRGLEL